MNSNTNYKYEQKLSVYLNAFSSVNFMCVLSNPIFCELEQSIYTTVWLLRDLHVTLEVAHVPLTVCYVPMLQ